MADREYSQRPWAADSAGQKPGFADLALEL
jgi:hypothetical protein